MYDSQNLPLSPWKIAKKSMAKLFGGTLIVVIFMLGIVSSIRRTIELERITGPDASSSTFGLLPAYTAPFSNIGSIVLFAYFFYAFVVLIYEYLYYKLYYYRFDDGGAEIRKGVISRATGHVRYDRLQNIYIDQDWLDRLFGLYDVHYETAGEASGFYAHVDGLPKDRADKLVTFLNEHTGRSVIPSSPPAVPAPVSAAAPTPPPAVNQSTEISSQEYPISPLHIWLSTITLTLVFSLMSLVFFLKVFTVIGPPVIALIIFILSYWYSSVWYRNFSFRFGPERGEVFTKVISQSTSYLTYDRIQNVNVSQSVIGRLFHLWAINIETAGETSGQRLTIVSLPETSAIAIRDFLLAKAGQQQAQL